MKLYTEDQLIMKVITTATTNSHSEIFHSFQLLNKKFLPLKKPSWNITRLNWKIIKSLLQHLNACWLFLMQEQLWNLHLLLCVDKILSLSKILNSLIDCFLVHWKAPKSSHLSLLEIISSPSPKNTCTLLLHPKCSLIILDAWENPKKWFLLEVYLIMTFTNNYSLEKSNQAYYSHCELWIFVFIAIVIVICGFSLLHCFKYIIV